MHHVYQLFRDYARNHRYSMFFFISFGLFWAFTLPYMAYLLGDIIDDIKNHGLKAIHLYQLVIPSLALYISIHVLRSLGYFAHAWFSLISITSQKKSMIKQLFSHLTGQSVSYFETRHSGAITSRLMNACLLIA